MRKSARLFVLLLVGLVTLSGCAAVRSMLAGGSAPSAGADAGASEAVAAEPAMPRFKFYDSWASW